MTILKPYPTYKDSEAEWLGDIPNHWETPRLKRLATINPSRMDVPSLPDEVPVTFLPMEKVSEAGRVDRSLSRPLQDVRNGFTYFKDGDVIVAKITPCFENGKAALVDDLDNGVGFGSTEFHVLRSHGRLDRRYLYRVVSSYDFRSLGEASMEGAGGQKRVPTEFVANFTTPLPPLDEQRAIADFLDGMDARITRFIAARRKMIALLEEKKQAVINQAVTRGLDPSVPMKDSGVDWLGEIPTQWDLLRLGSILRERGELNGDGLEDQVLSVVRGRGVIPYAEKGNIGNKASEDTSRYKLVKAGDLVLNSMNVIIGSLGLARIDGCLSPVYYVLKPINACSTSMKFYERLFQLTVFHRTLIRIGNGILAHRMRIPMEKLKAEILPVPPTEEQQLIVDHIEQETLRVDELVSRHRREIELMQEYRTRLISDVVTGKLDVRGVELPALKDLINEEIEAAMEDQALEEFADIFGVIEG